MTQQSRSARSLFTALTLGLALGTAQPALADGSVKLFTGAPPPAEELANMLFPEQQPRAPRTRSIVFTNTKPATKAPTQRPEGFGFLINFAFNSSDILPDSRPYLDQVGEMLNLEHVKDQKIVIEGHTDASGAESYNHSLSQQRATAVKQYLVQAHRIEPARLVTFGKGESELLPDRAPTDPMNRRVQFQRALP